MTGRFFAAGGDRRVLIMIALLVAAAIVRADPVAALPPTARCTCRPTWWR